MKNAAVSQFETRTRRLADLRDHAALACRVVRPSWARLGSNETGRKSRSLGNMRFAFALCLAVTLLAPIVSEGADRKESGGSPWIATTEIIQNGGKAGSGVYLKSGLIITAAHLTAVDVEMSVRIAGVVLPAKVLKQGSLEDVDLSLLLIDEEKLPTNIELPRMQLCEAPPWPGDVVIVVDAGHAARSHIVSPQVLPFTLRPKFSALIGDVATTGNSGSGVFDPNRKCLLGIMSRKFTSQTTEGDKDIAKYFVPAAEIRNFLPTEFRP
jgi:Trypsin-like peptidase domain